MRPVRGFLSPSRVVMVLLLPCRWNNGLKSDLHALKSRDAPLFGMMHAGGILRDAPISRQTLDIVCSVHAAKVAGSDLHELVSHFEFPDLV